MADEAEDQGNSAVIEGGEEIMSAIDGLFEGADQQQDTTQQGAETKGAGTPADQQQQQQETPEQAAARARNEKGQFTKEQQDAKDKADKAAADAKAKETTPTDPKDKEYPAEIKSPKAREHFDTVKKLKEDAERRATSAESKIKQLETQLQDLTSKSGTAAPEVKVLQTENAKLKEQLAEREQILSFKAVEETAAFKEGVTKPQEEALNEINEAAATYKLEGRSIDEILREPNKFKRREMLEELTEALPPRSQFVKEDLRNNIEKYIAAEAKSKELYANAKGSRDYAEHERQQTEAKAALERQEQYQKANKEVEGILKEKFPEIAGDPEKWAAIAEKAFKVADFDRMHPKGKAFANVASWIVMPLMEMYRKECADHAKTKEVMAKRNGATPSPTGGRSSTTKPGTDDDADIFAILDQELQDA